MPVGSSRRKIFLDAVLAPVVWAVSLRFRPQVVHAFLHEGALLGVLPARLGRIPLVFDFQGSLTGEMIDHGFLSEGTRSLAAWRRLERWIDHQPGIILASSQHAAAMLVTQFGMPEGRVRTVPDSVDVDRFRPATPTDAPQLAALRARWQLPPDRPLVVYLGLLAPYQGIDLLLEAVRTLCQRNASRLVLQPHFLVMGFPHVDRYRHQAQTLGIGDHVTFTGAIPFADAPAHLRLGTVAVAPKLSETEGSGKLLTYMATGLPVAAFDTPVHREYLGDLGVYAPPRDAEALADALFSLLADPAAAAARGRALRERAVRSYTWAEAAALIEAAYEQVVVKRKT
jgi:glycosyltransferase involved in cell wall biosynthesis